MQKPKLLDQVRNLMRIKHMSYKTERAYVSYIREYILFHNKTHPAEMGVDEIRDYLTHLAVEKNVAASTQNVAFNAILFLYKWVLEIKLPLIEGVFRAKKPKRLPVVFTPSEAKAIIAELEGTTRLIAGLLYGCGMRLTEVLRLRVKDIDFGMQTITVRDGKGARDRTTILPSSIAEDLREQIEEAANLHKKDLSRGFGSVYLPFALDRKYKNAEKEFVWQYVFPSTKISPPRKNLAAQRRRKTPTASHGGKHDSASGKKGNREARD